MIAAFEDAQTRAFALLVDVVGSLRAGIGEDACVRFATRSARTRGFTGFFRPPVIRFDPTAARFALPSRRTLRAGTLVEIVLLPVTWFFKFFFPVLYIFSHKILQEDLQVCNRKHLFAE